MNKAFIIIVLALQLLQSITALADTHQMHEQESLFAEYMENHKDHIDDKDTIANLSEVDCEHCCHCHGTTGPLMISSIEHSYSFSPHRQPTETLADPDSVFLVDLFRPPRS